MFTTEATEDTANSQEAAAERVSNLFRKGTGAFVSEASRKNAHIMD